MNMNEITGIASMVNWTQEINKSLGLANPMMSAINAQRDIWDKMMPHRNILDSFKSAVNMRDAIFGFHDPGGMLSMSQAIQKQFNTGFPSSALTAMDMIGKQQRQLFGISDSMMQMVKAGNVLTQMNSLQWALKDITAKITGSAAFAQRWDLIDDFEEISEQAIEFSSNLSPDLTLTEEQNRYFQDLLMYIYSILKKHRKIGIYSILFVDMVLRIASGHQYYDFLKSKPELAAKEDLVKLERKLFNEIHAILVAEKEYRITNRVCKVRLKPDSKSTVINSLSQNLEVVVLQRKGKWVYISFTDPQDNLSLTGWVMKKYLSKPKID